MKTVSFIDAGVLIAAATGQPALAQRAMDVLDDPAREFVSSTFVKLEVMPKPVYYRREDEIAFYEEFFRSVTRWAEPLADVVADAHVQANQFGLAAIDALHVSAAIATGAAELVTTEKAGKPIFRVKAVGVVSIQPTSDSR